MPDRGPGAVCGESDVKCRRQKAHILRLAGCERDGDQRADAAALVFIADTRLSAAPLAAAAPPLLCCRVQLVSLCRFVGIQPFGTDAFLRSRLRRHLLEIKVRWRHPNPIVYGLMAGT